MGRRARPRLPTPCSSRPRPSIARAASMTAPASPTSTRKNSKRHFSIDTSVLHLDTRASTSTCSTPPAIPTSSAPPSAPSTPSRPPSSSSRPINGVEVNTRRMFNEAGKRGLARIIVINKLDGDNVNFDELLRRRPRDLRQGLRPVQRPHRSGPELQRRRQRSGPPARRRPAAPSIWPPPDRSCVDAVVEVDEALMEKYLERGRPSPTTS